MKRIFLRALGIVLYCLAAAALCGRNPMQLLDLKEMLVVFAGIALMTFFVRPGKKEFFHALSMNCLASGILCTLIIILSADKFSALSDSDSRTFAFLATRCRPFFYGVILHFVFADAEKEEAAPEEKIPAEKEILTRREKQVAKMASAGLTNKEIADELFISEMTVKTHLANIYEKLGINSRHDLKEKISGDSVSLH